MRPLLRALARVPDPLSDAALLARYAADRDPAAFEVLVWRHGGMVLGVCRRHLRDAHAAEDAFQATFLVLARKAGSVRGDTLAGFLHRVARRVAGRAAVKARRRRETPLAVEPPARSAADGELAAVLDAEIDRLPDRLRQVVVLCYLDGESTEATAARLGIPRGTVLSRLHTARATLAARLTRRGVTPPAVGLAAVLTAEQVAGGVRAAGGGFGPATILANEVLAMSGRKTVLAVAVGLVLAGGAGTGVGVLNAQNGGPLGGGPTSKPQPPASTDRPKDEALREQASRRNKLQATLEDLDDKIAARRASIERLLKVNNAGPDAATAAAFAAALAADLARLSTDIYTEELANSKLVITILQRRGKVAASETAPIDPTELEERLTSDPQMQAQQAKLGDVERLLKNFDSTVDPNIKNSTGERLRANVNAERERLAETRKSRGQTVEKQLRAKLKRDAEARLKEDEELHDSRTKFLDHLNKVRQLKEIDLKELTKSIHAAKVEDEDLKLLLAHRAMVAEALLRQSIEQQPGSPPAVPSADKLDLILAEVRELRRLVEAKK